MWRAAAALTALAALTAACGDDDDSADDTTTTTEAEPEAETIDVTAIDYGYEGLPDEIEVGSTLTLTNASEIEAHELVAFRLPDGEARTLEELLALPEAEFGALVGGPPATVIVALPGEEGQAPPTYSTTISEPGRYVYACLIPVGTDPAVYAAALESGSSEPPPTPEGAVPHAAQGMAGEFTAS